MEHEGLKTNMDKSFLWTQFPPDWKDDQKQPPMLVWDYYIRPFVLFHVQLEKEGYQIETPHPIRSRFWGLLPPREYSAMEGRPLLFSYLRSLEENVAAIVEKQSLGYWLHLYRRLAPLPIGRDKKPTTVALVRVALEAAIQKYAKSEPCDRIGIGGDIPLSKVLRGLLVAPDFGLEREIIEKASQLVLTDFGPIELREFYDLEKLAYEIWRTSAMLRITGKGAGIAVQDDDLFDTRSEELNRLVTIFDERRRSPSVSAKGIVYDVNEADSHAGGTVFLPTYNVGRITTDDLRPFFERVYNLHVPSPIELNFIWYPEDLRAFRDAHFPFAEVFREEHGVMLDAVLVIIAALCYRVFFSWGNTGGAAIFHYWQRAYEGPYLRSFVLDEIEAWLPEGAGILGVDPGMFNSADVHKGFEYLELKVQDRSGIDLAYPGPHYMFLPYGSDRVFIDYAWVGRRLYDFFLGLNLPDQNFKGAALERVVRFKESVLPIGPCKSTSGQEKQVDAAFAIGRRLVIVECRAVGKSVAFDRGDPQAIGYRNQLLERTLGDIDAKARWLADNPVGANYDIRGFEEILPVGASPFVEYIPSLDSRYWVNPKLPRIMTPVELRDALEDGTIAAASPNVIHLV